MKVLFQNIAYLYLVRAISLISPLFVIPHLFKVLGSESFGALFFVQSFTLYLGILIDFGFELHAPGRLARIKNDRKISVYTSKVQISKFILAVSVGAVLVLTCVVFHQYINWTLYLSWYLVICIQSSIPIWFFQGIGELSVISIIQACGRVLSLLLTLWVVQEPDDAFFYPIIESAVLLIVSIVSWRIYFKMGYGVVGIKLLDVYNLLKESSSLFVSKVSISLYTISGTFILGLMASPVVVAYYAAPMKIIEALGSLMGPINQVIYPFISSRVSSNEPKIEGKYLKIYILISLFLGIIVSSGLLTFQNFIVFTYLKAEDDIVLSIFRVMSIFPTFIFLSNVLGIQILLGHGYYRKFSRIISTSSVVGLALILLLTYFYSALGTATAILIVEIIITLWMLYQVRKDVFLS